MSLFDVSTDNLFAASLMRNDSAQLEQIAQRTLSTGLQKFIDKRYDEAIFDFQRAIGMAPRSSTAINAYDYIAKSYVTLGDNKKAIEALQKSLKIDPNRDTTHLTLGNIYYSEDRFTDARDAYEKAVKLNSSSTNRFSLGQGYLASDQYDEAIGQFEAVRRMEPTKPYAEFGLGQAYAKQGRYGEALDAFQRSLSIRFDYYDAYSEMGYVYADMGNMDKANEMAAILTNPRADLAATLNAYIYEKSAPRIEMGYSTTSELYKTFPTSLGPGTKVADMSVYLTDPLSESTFTMTFVFGKQMSKESVEDTDNWTIRRQPGRFLGDGYNFGMTPQTTEILLDQRPVSVSYNEKDQTATVLFTIRQNETGDGTLDPLHIQFKFSGTDVLGLAMDRTADEYSGFSGIA